MNMNIGITVREYEEKLAKTSRAKRLSPAGDETKKEKPIRPTKAMAKPTGMLRQKVIIRTTIPMIPIAIGLTSSPPWSPI